MLYKLKEIAGEQSEQGDKKYKNTYTCPTSRLLVCSEFSLQNQKLNPG